LAAGKPEPDVAGHDGEHSKNKCIPIDKNPCSKKNMHCQDNDADGHWECICKEGYAKDENGACEKSSCGAYGDDNDKGQYMTVKTSGECLYFEQQSLSLVDAVARCKTKFQGKGRLLEPRTTQSNDNAALIARTLSPKQAFWIGIRARIHDEDRKFYYISQGPKEKKGDSLDIKHWTPGGSDELSGNKDCVTVLQFQDIKWTSEDCTANHFAICEIPEEDKCGKPEYANDFFCDDENNKAGCHWDGGACCNRDLWEFEHWKSYCTDCECKDPNAREPSPCEDKEKTCKKKCKGNKCKKNNWCKTNCQKHCGIC